VFGGPHEPEVLVLGTGVEALGTIRSLGRRGIRSYVHGTPRCRFLERSRFYRALPETEALPPPQIERLLSRVQARSLVLLPCADPWVLAVAALPAAWRDRFPSCVAPAETICTLVDKGRLAHALAQHGVPHPWTCAISRPADLDRLAAAAFDGAAFLKPRLSHAFQQRFGVKGFRFRDRAEATQRAAEALDAGLEVVVQEYIPGPPSCHYFVDGFKDRQGRTRALFARRRLRMYPPQLGNSSALVSVALGEVEPALERLDGLLTALAYRGAFSAELKRDPRDGVLKLLEVNVRPWWYVEFAAQAGVDVPLMIYRDALGQDPGDTREYRVGLRLVYPEFDRRACAELFRRGELGGWQWARSWLGARQPLLVHDDPWPAVADAAERLLGLARRATRAG
jgi:D-aspartate ligase